MPKFHWFFNPLREAEGVAAGGTPPAAPAVPPTGETPPAQPATPPVPGSPEAAAPKPPEGNGSLIPGEAGAEGDKPADPAPVEEPLKVEDLKLPEGLAADDPGLAKVLETLASKDLKPAERAQALLDTYKENVASVGEAVQAKMAADYKAINDGWVAEVRADPVLSKPEAMGVVAKALDTFGNGPELRKAFALTGAGNNPHVIRLIHTMASQLAEGRPTNGGVPAGKKSMGEIFYGTPAIPA